MAIEGGLLRPAEARRPFLEAVTRLEARVWIWDRESWTSGTNEWECEVERYDDSIAEGGAVELLVTKATFDPADREAFKSALQAFDAGTDSDIYAWAVQDRSDPCATAFLAPQWLGIAEDCLRPFVKKTEVRPYAKLGPRQLGQQIPFILRANSS